MLLKLSDKIRECFAYAEEARERANLTTDPGLRADFLDMEMRWLRLVESYRFVEQASLFLEDSHLARTLPAEKPRKTGTLVVTCPVTGKEYSTGILTDEVSLARLSPQESTRAHCPHCNAEHSWWPRDAKLVEALPPSQWVEFVRAQAAKTNAEPGQAKPATALLNGASLADSLAVLVRTTIENAGAEARAAFYLADADGATLHHVVGMSEAYARCVDGFAIGPQSLACGLAAATRQPILTRDVVEEPRWQPWLWLAKQFDYRACWSFPVETSAGKVVGSFAIYHKDPREATPRDLDLASAITRTAAIMISRPPPAIQ